MNLHTVIRQLIEDQRLTGVTTALALDGEPFLAPGDDQVDPVDAIQWGPDGFSAQRSPWGGAMVREVEAARAQAQSAAAAALPQWFVVADLIDGEAEPKQEFTARENQTYVFVTRQWAGFRDPRAVALMTEYSPRYFKKGTTEPEWRYLPAKQVDHVRGGSNPGASIPNHRIVVGKWTAAQLGAWAAAWLGRYSAGQHDPNSEVLGQ